jgi:hypothetical protein
MSQYNLAATSSTGAATKVVSAGDPVTLVLNHSTKNTVFIGKSSSVGSGNLLDATPLDPYASIVVNGVDDVWAIAEVASEPATVYTYQNSINWSPKAIQPNIVDPQSPITAGIGSGGALLNVPPGAQGLVFIFFDGNSGTTTQLNITGEQSGIAYLPTVNPSTQGFPDYWVPVLSDADTQVSIGWNTLDAQQFSFVWIMNGFVSGLVQSGQTANVNIAGVSLPSNVGIPVTNVGANLLNVAVMSISSPRVEANQVAIPFDVTLAVNATAVLLPASAGITYFLHDFRVDSVNAAITYAVLEDTSGNHIANIYSGQNALPILPLGPNQFHGSPIGASGVGLQILNNGTAAQRFIGYLTYGH